MKTLRTGRDGGAINQIQEIELNLNALGAGSCDIYLDGMV